MGADAAGDDDVLDDRAEHEMRRHIEEPGEWLRDALAQEEEEAGQARVKRRV